ncbi:glycosyl hydrolase family 28-related protein [Paenarthrobacter sp. RAF54_2]|uniref:glycosyl hydrolase family 28-related protein n=1 Tax=Paenarthrobacter sp. RAF54_2 TaxID=3233061 RepID=UPI003F9A75F0
MSNGKEHVDRSVTERTTDIGRRGIFKFVPLATAVAASEGLLVLNSGSAHAAGIASTVSAATDPSAQYVLRTNEPVNARDYGAVGDGIADDSVAITAALRAAGGRSVVLPAGTYLIPSATRLQMFASYSSLVGDPSGSSVLRFTHPSGGIDVGNGTDFIYQNLIQNLVIDGFNIAQTPLRLRKSEEMGMVNVRVHQAVVAAIETTDTSLFHSTRLQLARAPIGIKTLGYLGTAGLHDGNFYLLDSIVSVEGTGVAHLVVSGVTYIELVKAGVRFNRVGGPISIGTIHFRDCYVTSSLAEFSLFKGVAATGINAGALLATDLNAYLPNVTTPPFVDFRGLNNSGSTLRARLTGGNFTLTSLGSGKLVAVHKSQNWFQFFVTLASITGAATSQFANLYVTGGVALSPLQLVGSGSPEKREMAPVGSTYQNYGGGAGTTLYVKQSGNGSTGWVGK